MPFAERVESLRTKHAALEEEIRNESLRPASNTAMLSRLKREKLQVKEELERLAAPGH